MEIIVFCVTLTSIMAVLLVGIGVQIGRSDNRDTDNSVCVPDGDRDRSSVGRYSAEEMIFVLDNVKRVTHGEERAIMDAIIEFVEGSKNNELD